MDIAKLSDKMHQVVIIKNVTEKEQCFKYGAKEKGIILEAGKTVNVTVSDLLTYLNGDKFLYGVDSKGTLATLKVMNDDIREALGFIERNDKGEITREQVLLDKKTFIDTVKKLKNQKDVKEFVALLSDLSWGNKIMLLTIIKDKKTNIGSITANNFNLILEALNG